VAANASTVYTGTTNKQTTSPSLLLLFAFSVALQRMHEGRGALTLSLRVQGAGATAITPMPTPLPLPSLPPSHTRVVLHAATGPVHQAVLPLSSCPLVHSLAITTLIHILFELLSRGFNSVALSPLPRRRRRRRRRRRCVC